MRFLFIGFKKLSNNKNYETISNKLHNEGSKYKLNNLISAD